MKPRNFWYGHVPIGLRICGHFHHVLQNHPQKKLCLHSKHQNIIEQSKIIYRKLTEGTVSRKFVFDEIHHVESQEQ